MATWVPIPTSQIPNWAPIAVGQVPSWGLVNVDPLVGNGFQVGPFQLNFQQAHKSPPNWTPVIT